MKKQFIAALLIFLPGLALAAEAPQFKKVDINGDGVLSDVEFSAAGTAVDFKSADQNSDGGIDEAEYPWLGQASDTKARYTRVIPAGDTTITPEQAADSEPMVVTGESESQLMHDTKAAMDLLIARPLGVAGTVVGTGLYIASLPVTYSTGSTDAARKVLVEAPFDWTFRRPLGEKSSSY